MIDKLDKNINIIVINTLRVNTERKNNKENNIHYMLLNKYTEILYKTKNKIRIQTEYNYNDYKKIEKALYELYHIDKDLILKEVIKECQDIIHTIIALNKPLIEEEIDDEIFPF